MELDECAAAQVAAAGGRFSGRTRRRSSLAWTTAWLSAHAGLPPLRRASVTRPSPSAR